MNIPKAIEILSMAIPDPDSVTALDLIDAQYLGIEALKRQLAKETLTFTGMMEPLPGETEND